ncbi:hypothetical protein AVEN_203726-1 [Araneus ventricosus]|uniref:Uncharacterized protein n=1 Tax=Araneus ventricosus TaxID=182803 RepID=A0A4Y2IRB6_ARAVE|nr:hypothetical protein AVEN_203726-1 [Araneus ventricosus]
MGSVTDICLCVVPGNAVAAAAFAANGARRTADRSVVGLRSRMDVIIFNGRYYRICIPNEEKVSNARVIVVFAFHWTRVAQSRTSYGVARKIRYGLSCPQK